MFPLHQGANVYFECKRLSFCLDWVDCRPRKTSLSVLRVNLRVPWHQLKTRLLESLTNSMESYSLQGNTCNIIHEVDDLYNVGSMKHAHYVNILEVIK